MSVRDIADPLHRLLPVVSAENLPSWWERYQRTLQASICIATFVLNQENNATVEEISYNGGQSLKIDVCCDDLSLTVLLDKLAEYQALYHFGNMRRANDGSIEHASLVLGSYDCLTLHYGISILDDTLDAKAYVNTATHDLMPYVLDLLFAGWNSKDVEPDVIRYYADRLAVGEVRGSHMLALQNFVYGLAK